MNTVKLSISVMAHPSRAQFFPYLQEKLSLPLSQFSIDQKNNLIENSRAAWALHDPTADFHVVVQDDAIVCDNFREKAAAFIAAQEAKRRREDRPAQGYNFFLRLDRNKTPLWPQDGAYIDKVTRGGVAICLPVAHIAPMIREYDRQRSKHDDDRISEYVKRNNVKIIFPVPSFIGHRSDVPSVANNPHSLDVWKFSGREPVTIPKIIHQLWVGPLPRPTKWMDTWREKHPTWEYRLWGNDEIRGCQWANQKHLDYFWNRKIWHGVSDVCTYEILYHNGGFMIGADSICLHPTDELYYNDYDSYSVYENEKVRPGLISPLHACVPGSQFAKELIDGLRRKTAVGEPWKTTGNLYMCEMFRKTKARVKIFPSHYFNPEHFTGEKYMGTDKIYARQMWGTTIVGYVQGVPDKEKKPIKLSISVMAHPSREQFFPHLKKQLGDDVPFSIDRTNNLIENAKAAWRLHDKTADFHVVIQDDCVVCKNFRERAVRFITEQEEKRVAECRRPQGYNFFLKNADDGSELDIQGNFHVDEWTRAGLAICLPVRYIEQMLEDFALQKSRHDDDRISMYMQKHQYKIVFPYPSLVDHRIELESLAHNVVGNRAIKFIDNEV